MLKDLNQHKSSFISGLAMLRLSNLYMNAEYKEESNNNLLELINNKNIDQNINDLALYLLLISNFNEVQENNCKDYLTSERLESSKFKPLFNEIIAIDNL